MQTKENIKAIYLNYSTNDDYLIQPFIELLDNITHYHKQQSTKNAAYSPHTLNQQHLINQVDTRYLADCFIVFWSKHSANEARIIENYQQSATTDQTIIFVLLDETPLPKTIQHDQTIDLMPFVKKHDSKSKLSKKYLIPYFLLSSLSILIVLLLALPNFSLFIMLIFGLLLIAAFVLSPSLKPVSFTDLEYFMIRFYGTLFPDTVDNDEVKQLLYELSDNTPEHAQASDTGTMGHHHSSPFSHSSACDGGSSSSGGDGGG
ncbi:MAG: hypothetical protein ACWA5U_08100 [bacterium]